MSKRITLVVDLSFNDDINTDNETLVNEIGKKVLNSIVSEVDHGNGIVPESADTFTTEVVVSHKGIIVESNKFI